jgi:hypothetical protein
MSDEMEATIGATLADQIEAVIVEQLQTEEYITIRTVAKKLNIKQMGVSNNIPAGYKMLPAANGGLSEARIVPKTEQDYEDIVSQDIIESEEVHEQVAKMLPKRERKKKVEQETVAEIQYDEEGNPIPQEEAAEKVICAICGNPVRKSSIVRRGICPLCFRQLAKNVGMNATKLEALSDEEFEVVLGEELGRRRTQEERKVERTLTADQFKDMGDQLIPVKELFAAGKAKGYGPGRVAQAVGGDRFRHEPIGGYGSVWTPYFVGARNAWYFDKAILDELDKLAKPVREPKAKSTSGKTAGVGRKGARGAEMTPVVEDDGDVTQEMEGTAEEV